jgi:hypothetical protein
MTVSSKRVMGMRILGFSLVVLGLILFFVGSRAAGIAIAVSGVPLLAASVAHARKAAAAQSQSSPSAVEP